MTTPPAEAGSLPAPSDKDGFRTRLMSILSLDKIGICLRCRGTGRIYVLARDSKGHAPDDRGISKEVPCDNPVCHHGEVTEESVKKHNEFLRRLKNKLKE